LKKNISPLYLPRQTRTFRISNSIEPLALTKFESKYYPVQKLRLTKKFTAYRDNPTPFIPEEIAPELKIL
jgi:hypothetical protein